MATMPIMWKLRLRSSLAWLLAWVLVAGAGAWWLANDRLATLQAEFDTEARIAHRLLSQRVVQHDAVLATLALLDGGGAPGLEQQLRTLYPSILEWRRRAAGAAWSQPELAEAERQSRALRRPVLALPDLPHARYVLVLAAADTVDCNTSALTGCGASPLRSGRAEAHALTIDLAATVPWRDWPTDPRTSSARMVLDGGAAGGRFEIQVGNIGTSGWHYGFHKHLASDSQAFDVVAERQVRWSELPWPAMAAWALLMAVMLLLLHWLQRQRTERRRAEELLRLGQVARLNALGELAAGMAHELNQPLTAMLANTQAAQRLLDDDPPELATARGAMARAAEQARRASDVVGRLRRAIERPAREDPSESVALHDAVRNALHLLEPECRRHGVAVDFAAAQVQGSVRVRAQPVALEQIVHNLLLNALQALNEVPVAERRIMIDIATRDSRGQLSVSDSGPGIAPERLARVFEPFHSTRPGGLGLGLSLCETLAGNMGGALVAASALPRGARFTLSLPLA